MEKIKSVMSIVGVDSFLVTGQTDSSWI